MAYIIIDPHIVDIPTDNTAVIVLGNNAAFAKEADIYTTGNAAFHQVTYYIPRPDWELIGKQFPTVPAGTPAFTMRRGGNSIQLIPDVTNLTADDVVLYF